MKSRPKWFQGVDDRYRYVPHFRFEDLMGRLMETLLLSLLGVTKGCARFAGSVHVLEIFDFCTHGGKHSLSSRETSR
jgi:hypothetical protein